MRFWQKHILVAGAMGGMALLSGCTRDGKFQAISMWNESRLKPYEASPMPGEASSSRRPPAGTIARGQLASVDPVYTGRSEDGKLLTRIPVAVTEETLRRGQERYNVYCSPCHSRTGDGAGMIVLRGFPPPPDYGLVRLRNASVGHFYDVITNGYGIMYSYADRIPTSDRWAISAYLRVLQKKRPVVKVDETLEQRQKARQSGIPDPHRGMNLDHEQGQGGQEGHGATQPGPGAPHNPATPPTSTGEPPLPGGSEHSVPPGQSKVGDPTRGGTEVKDPIAPSTGH